MRKGRVEREEGREKGKGGRREGVREEGGREDERGIGGGRRGTGGREEEWKGLEQRWWTLLGAVGERGG